MLFRDRFQILLMIWWGFEVSYFAWIRLTLSWWRPLLYRNQSIDLFCKSVDCFLYDNGFRHELLNIRSKIWKWSLNNAEYQVVLKKMGNLWDSFSPVLRFIQKPAILFALIIKGLASIWNTTPGGLK